MVVATHIHQVLEISIAEETARVDLATGTEEISHRIPYRVFKFAVLRANKVIADYEAAGEVVGFEPAH